MSTRVWAPPPLPPAPEPTAPPAPVIFVTPVPINNIDQDDDADALLDTIAELQTKVDYLNQLVRYKEELAQHQYKMYDQLVRRGRGPPLAGPTVWVWADNRDAMVTQKGKIIKPFPTSPKPRASLGAHQVRVYPPPRRQGDVLVKPMIDDWRIPENTMVFRVVKRFPTKLNYKGAPETGKRRRTAVVEDVFANWYNRALYHAPEPRPVRDIDPQNGVAADMVAADLAAIARGRRSDDYDIEFAGVSYEGVTDPVAASRVPDIKGRFTVSVNGIVSLFRSFCCVTLSAYSKILHYRSQFIATRDTSKRKTHVLEKLSNGSPGAAGSRGDSSRQSLRAQLSASLTFGGTAKCRFATPDGTMTAADLQIPTA